MTQSPNRQHDAGEQKTNRTSDKMKTRKFKTGDKVTWKGHAATVKHISDNATWGFYVITCANGDHVLDFADEHFAVLI